MFREGVPCARSQLAARQEVSGRPYFGAPWPGSSMVPYATVPQIGRLQQMNLVISGDPQECPQKDIHVHAAGAWLQASGVADWGTPTEQNCDPRTSFCPQTRGPCPKPYGEAPQHLQS